MKKILFCIFSAMLFNVVIKAQNILDLTIDSSGNGKSFMQNMEEMIEPLDKTEITTGILSDKAFIFSTMDTFNGENDTPVITRPIWEQIYRQLYNGSITEQLPTLDSIRSMSSLYSRENIIPISLVNVKYNEIKGFALDSNLLQFIDGKLYDVEGRNQTPYYEKRAFAVTLLKDEIYTGLVNFKIDENFFITNTTDTITSVEINFGDGLNPVIISGNNKKNSNIMRAYAETGPKILTVKVSFSDNMILQAKARFTIASVTSVSADDSFSVSGYLPYGGLTGTGKAYVLYGCGNNSQLRKPIIVSDGFDPPGQHERHFDELYNLLNQENFIEKARGEGFDFVILDYHSGADYIQRNAYVLISLINTVNIQLLANGSNHQLIVVGPSMAGLISRYALYYMEQNNLKHNTRLYISFDSPHLGANIPLGDQYWFNFFATYAGATEGRDVLLTPAAQQMLVYHYSSFQGQHPLRTALLNDAYFHFPSQCRKIAIANGSGNNNQYFNPCDQMVSWEYHIDNIGDVIRGNTWAVPGGGYCQIFDGKVPTSFITIGGIKIPKTFATFTVSVGGTQPYDNAPGGAFKVNQQMIEGLTEKEDLGEELGSFYTNHPTHCFIPTVSALALNGAGLYYNVLQNVPNYPYPNNPSITPFDAIFTPNSNQDHVRVTQENLMWIMDEASPLELFLQNQTITTNASYEARNKITIGSNVDPVPNRQPAGSFIVNNGATADMKAGQVITIKDNTWFKEGSKVHLFIEPFPCAEVHRLANSNMDNSSQEDILASSNNWTDFVYKEITQTESPLNFLSGNYPNPFTDHTHIDYIISDAGAVNISVYDISGQKVATLVKDNHPPGKYTATLDARKLSPGIYFCKMETENYSETRKMIMMK